MKSNLQVIEALANGVNPLTGEVLPNESPYNDPEIIRALFSVIEYIRAPIEKGKRPKKTIKQKQEENLEKGLPINAGLPWTEQSQSLVNEQFRAGKTCAQLAEQFGRTEGAIHSKLIKQGLIEH